MYLGLNISHDSSAALLNEQGILIAAISEERFTRKKHHMTLPLKSIEYLIKEYSPQISKVVVGSISDFHVADRFNLAWIFEPWEVVKFDGFASPHSYPPGFKNEKSDSWNIENGEKLREVVENKLRRFLNNLGITSQIIFEDHHDGHIFSAFAGFEVETGLAISLDGYGDGFSGTIKEFSIDEHRKYQVSEIVRFSRFDSLGFLYSAVTERYNFRSNSHEGKITGLAAYGSDSEMLEFLQKKVVLKNGKIKVRIPKSRIIRLVYELLYRISKSDRFVHSYKNLADVAASKKGSYPDLAYAVQYILESAVIELVKHHLRLTKKRNVFLAGGIFANVKLNQRIAEMKEVESVHVFPNMGDGGLAVGGVWSYMFRQGQLNCLSRFNSMYLGNDIYYQIDKENIKADPEIKIYSTTESENIDAVAQYLADGLIVGTCMGRMEFGPRALLNRTIFASPIKKEINNQLNRRLRRTEFMPFAPVVNEENALLLFDLEDFKDRTAFKYMTMTCTVNKKWIDQIPAVVHIDGTARPQIVDQLTHPFGHALLNKFQEITGIPCLVNTSFNIHEEPIVATLDDAIIALKHNSVDVITTGKELIILSSNLNLRNHIKGIVQ